MQIDSEKYRIGDDNRYKPSSVKTQIVIGTSLRKDNHHIIRLLHKEFGKTKKWNTYTITREGKIYEHYDSNYHTDFLGIKEADKKSISIVIENMGCLFETDSGKFINWINETCDEENVIEKKWFYCNYWEKIPSIQIEALAELCISLCEKHNIPKLCIDFNHHHKDIVKFNGIVFRSNYVEDSSDANPLLDIAKFNEMLCNK